jgi:hypothetical protein
VLPGPVLERLAVESNLLPAWHEPRFQFKSRPEHQELTECNAAWAPESNYVAATLVSFLGEQFNRTYGAKNPLVSTTKCVWLLT